MLSVIYAQCQLQALFTLSVVMLRVIVLQNKLGHLSVGKFFFSMA